MTKEVVRFIRSCSPYTTNDVAGFLPDKAKQLVSGGYAVYVDRQMKPAESVEEVREQLTKESDAPKKKKKKTKRMKLDIDDEGADE